MTGLYRLAAYVFCIKVYLIPPDADLCDGVGLSIIIIEEYYGNLQNIISITGASSLEISKTCSRPPPKLAYAQTLVAAIFRCVNRF